ncbi:hypothetical protein CROQUDRAFT_103535 [Cronartium quercuum f. sp. fusiforme G11]|uniref:Uncharacterized protein n=1 Tax=Cronartium quercuum f. sp. fusiforme G11 TaxID=708437 RepID=A0A9P6TH93_9BASI|nr:hypothetical protein CROQUDRAFT_103535 [Cronartium quercuum f. sp. fusiforme G11]
MRRYVKCGHAEVDTQQVDVEPPLPPALEIGSRRCRRRAPSGPGSGATTVMTKVILSRRSTKISEGFVTKLITLFLTKEIENSEKCVVAPGPGPLGARRRHRREPISRAGGSGGSTSTCCVSTSACPHLTYLRIPNKMKQENSMRGKSPSLRKYKNIKESTRRYRNIMETRFKA